MMNDAIKIIWLLYNYAEDNKRRVIAYVESTAVFKFWLI